MKALRELLNDRRRAQRGSVLSAALIMVAFLAIVSGALMTALSTNFLLSTDLVNRINAEAAVNSATELGINRLQRAPSLNSACPTPVVTPTLNGLTAVATVAHCAAVVDRSRPVHVADSGRCEYAAGRGQEHSRRRLHRGCRGQPVRDRRHLQRSV